MAANESQGSDPGIFGELFQLLEPSHDNGLRTKKAPYLFGDESIYAGRDSRGNPHLLVPLQQGQNLKAEMLSNYIGYEKRELKHPSGEVVLFLDLFCLDTGVDELFSPICFDISERLAKDSNTDVNSVTSVLLEVISKWREILKAFENTSVSGSEIVGLVGELLTLRSLISNLGASALDAWVGQDKTRHDFEFATLAYESKASTSHVRKSCQIHGLNQLAVPAGTDLQLVHFQIERAAGAYNISQLVKELGEMVGGKIRIQEKIKSIWHDIDNEPSWFHTWTFKVTSASRFKVDELFPKITSEMLSKGSLAYISNVSYSLNLEGVTPIRSEDGLGWQNVCAD